MSAQASVAANSGSELHLDMLFWTDKLEKSNDTSTHLPLSERPWLRQ